MLCDVIESNFSQMDQEMRPKFLELRRLLEKSKADQKWYLDILSTLTQGQHPIFAKNYVPTPRQSPNDAPYAVANTNGFFTGLPMPSHKRGGSAALFLTADQQEQRALVRMETQQAALNLRMQKQRDKLLKAQQKQAE